MEKYDPLKSKKNAEEVARTKKALGDSLNPKLTTLDGLIELDKKRKTIKEIDKADKKNN